MDFFHHVRNLFSNIIGSSFNVSQQSLHDQPSEGTFSRPIFSTLEPSNSTQTVKDVLASQLNPHDVNDNVEDFSLTNSRAKPAVRIETGLRQRSHLLTHLPNLFSAGRSSTYSHNFKRTFNSSVDHDEFGKTTLSSIEINSSRNSLWAQEAAFIPPPTKRSRLVTSNPDTSLLNGGSLLTNRPKEKSLYADILQLYCNSSNSQPAQNTSTNPNVSLTSLVGGKMRSNENKSQKSFLPYPSLSRNCQGSDTSRHFTSNLSSNLGDSSSSCKPYQSNQSNVSVNQSNRLHFLRPTYNSHTKLDENEFLSMLRHYTSSLLVKNDDKSSSHLQHPSYTSISPLSPINVMSSPAKSTSLPTNEIPTTDLESSGRNFQYENSSPVKDEATIRRSSSSESADALSSSEESLESGISLTDKNTNVFQKPWTRRTKTFFSELEKSASTCDHILQRFDYTTARNLQRWSVSEVESTVAAKFWSVKNAERLSNEVDKITKRLRRIMHERPDYDSLYLSTLPELEPDVEEEEEVLPELTAQVQSSIREHLNRSDDLVVVEAFRLTISVRDLRTLYGLNWLSDQIINYYMQLIQDRSETAHSSGNTSLPKSVVVSTFFYTKLSEAGFSGVRRWTRNSAIFKKDLLFVPIHMGVHWCMLCVDMKNKTVTYYDSMGQRNDRCLNIIRDFLVEEAADKEKMTLKTDEWSFVNAQKECPQQENGSDCGVFSCICAEYLSRGRPLTYSQSQMPYFRQKMMHEIISKQFM